MKQPAWKTCEENSHSQRVVSRCRYPPFGIAVERKREEVASLSDLLQSLNSNRDGRLRQTRSSSGTAHVSRFADFVTASTTLSASLTQLSKPLTWRRLDRACGLRRESGMAAAAQLSSHRFSNASCSMQQVPHAVCCHGDCTKPPDMLNRRFEQELSNDCFSFLHQIINILSFFLR